jgi:hypothetical protein
MFATTWWRRLDQPRGSRGVDDVFARQHGPGIGAETLVADAESGDVTPTALTTPAASTPSASGGVPPGPSLRFARSHPNCQWLQVMGVAGQYTDTGRQFDSVIKYLADGDLPERLQGDSVPH